MTSGFPTTFDSFAINKTDELLQDDDHPAHHNDLADAVNKIERGVVAVRHVKGFGALGDNSTNDTAAIQAAITDLPAAGGIVYAPASVYVVNGTLDARDKENVWLLGDRASQAVYQSTPTTGTVFKRVSGTGTMLEMGATAAAQSIRGCGIQGITFDGNNLAATVVKLTSLYGGVFRDLHIREGTSVGLALTTVNLAGVEDLQSCLFENITIRCVATASAKGMTADSHADGGGNVSVNNFHRLLVYTQNGTGIELGDTDTNTFMGVLCNRSGTAIGIDLLGANHASSGHARHNVFLHVDAVGGITARATGFTLPSQNNYVLLSRGNSTPLPTIEAGASLYVQDTTGLTIGVRENHRRSYYAKDDFIGGSASTGFIGELGWISAGTGTVTRPAGEAGHPGIVRLDSTATISTICAISPTGNGTTTMLPAEMFDMTFIVRLNTNDADTLVRLGLAAASNSNPSANGIWVEKDNADTSWAGITRASSVETQSANLVAVGTGWVKFRIRRVNPTTIGFTVDDGTEVTQTTNIPTTALHPFLQIRNNAAAAKTIDMDFWDIHVTGLSR